MKKEIKALHLDQEKQNHAVNEVEQYGWRECLEISGIPPKTVKMLIISKKVHSNGTVEITETCNDDKDKDLLPIYEKEISGGRSGYQGKCKKTEA